MSELEAGKKVVFMHIPKTAGTSLRVFLVKAEYPSAMMELYPPFTPQQQADITAAMPSMQVAYGHVYFGVHSQFNFDACYVTFLRDPVERVISYYNHNAYHHGSLHHDAIQKGATLLDILRQESDPQTNNLMVRQISGLDPVHMIAEEHYLQRAIANIKNDFVFVGLVERMHDSVQRLAEKLGWTDVAEFPVDNVTPRRAVTDIDENTRSVVEQYNSLDRLLYDRVMTDF